MIQVLLVGCGGFVGAAGRYGLSLLLTKPDASAFPTGTFACNLLGCLLIGTLLPGEKVLVDGNLRLLFVTGLLGGFTTFSAFGHEGITLFRRGAPGLAAVYVLGSLVLGLAAVWLGRALGSQLVR